MDNDASPRRNVATFDGEGLVRYVHVDPSKPVVCSVTELCLGSIRAGHDAGSGGCTALLAKLGSLQTAAAITRGNSWPGLGKA